MGVFLSVQIRANCFIAVVFYYRVIFDRDISSVYYFVTCVNGCTVSSGFHEINHVKKSVIVKTIIIPP